VICEYLDSLASGHKFFPLSGPARWIAVRQQALGDGILDALVLCRYEALRPEDRCWSGWTDGRLAPAPPEAGELVRDD
jgi:glutathione S-transferase